MVKDEKDIYEQYAEARKRRDGAEFLLQNFTLFHKKVIDQYHQLQFQVDEANREVFYLSNRIHGLDEEGPFQPIKELNV